MQYRKFGDISLSAIGFGTATFVKGKFNPNADSAKGIEALEGALDLGVNVIHSSYDLATQWAVREVMKKNVSSRHIFHVVKIKLPLEMSILDATIEAAITQSLDSLGIDQIDIVEHHFPTISQFNFSFDNQKEYLLRLRCAFEKMKDQGKVSYLVGMVDGSDKLIEATNHPCYDGYAAYFNLVESWVAPFLEKIEQSSFGLIAFRVLKFGELVGLNGLSGFSLDDRVLPTNKPESRDRLMQSIAVNFVLKHAAVKSAIIGMGDYRHVVENVGFLEKQVVE